MSWAYVFPGQGSQAVGMGKELAAAFAEAREIFGEEMGYLPWQRPGIDLGIKLGEMASKNPHYVGVVLGSTMIAPKRPISTWIEPCVAL